MCIRDSGNVVLGYEVAIDCLTETFRALETSAAGKRRVRLDVEDVTLLISKRGGEVVELLLRVSRENRLAAAEGDIDLGYWLVLIEAVDSAVESGDVVRGCLLYTSRCV